MTTRYELRHETSYSYDADVTDSYGVAHVVPRELAWQRVLEHRVAITPEPSDLRTDVDALGNTVTYFQVDRPHRRLVVEARGLLEVDAAPHDETALAVPWEQARPMRRPDVPDAWRAVDLALASPAVSLAEAAHAYAARSLAPGRPLGEAVRELAARVHADFEYQPGATTVSSTVEDVVAARAGVCQDFAHLMLAGLRSHGLAGRYVSGYLATQPPPGQERLVGADASHAWVAVWVPGDGWLALDPTNDQATDERYVTLAWGRDYADVTPVKGVIVTEAEHSRLEVAVDLAPC